MTRIDSKARMTGIIQQLREMRLPIMADRLQDFAQIPQTAKQNWPELLEIMVNEEFQSRKENTVKRHRKQARLSLNHASVTDINYKPERKINASLIEQLTTNDYICCVHNVIIQGATGTGKTYIANALANNALEAGYTARYYRMTELLNDLQLAEMDNQIAKFLKHIARFDLLIIDDFLLTGTNEIEQKLLMEIFELRDHHAPLILCSQMETGEWHKKLGSGAIADAVLDRALSNSHHLFISGESQRK